MAVFRVFTVDQAGTVADFGAIDTITEFMGDLERLGYVTGKTVPDHDSHDPQVPVAFRKENIVAVLQMPDARPPEVKSTTPKSEPDDACGPTAPRTWKLPWLRRRS